MAQGSHIFSFQIKSTLQATLKFYEYFNFLWCIYFFKATLKFYKYKQKIHLTNLAFLATIFTKSLCNSRYIATQVSGYSVGPGQPHESVSHNCFNVFRVRFKATSVFSEQSQNFYFGNLSTLVVVLGCGFGIS